MIDYRQAYEEAADECLALTNEIEAAWDVLASLGVMRRPTDDLIDGIAKLMGIDADDCRARGESGQLSLWEAA